ncbi:MAG: nucleotidyltransferase domain-containing protein [Nanoarchaeota archaeon]|nr:nucleotidyltransferase domain-containing protein [Nanoarchaeota archaeon]
MITKDSTLKVMEIFFKYPEKKFHLRELERLIGLSMPGIRKIVEKLKKEGLLKVKKEKVVKNVYATRNEKFVQLKRIYNIYSIFESGLLDFLRKEYEEPKCIVLFGSYSKGEDISKSDIDIAIITKKRKELNLSKFEKKLRRVIKIYEIDVKKSDPEFLNTLANGVVLYGYLKVV